MGVRWLKWITLLEISVVAGASPPSLIDILDQELTRNFSILKEKADPAPYYLAFAVTEEESQALVASHGALRSRSQNHSRAFDVTIRVGSPKLDNYHRLPQDTPHFTTGVLVSLDDVPGALQRRAWLETDRAYRLAAQRLMKIRTDTQVKVAAEDDSDDFSREEPSVSIEPVQALRFDGVEWEARLRKLSGLFAKHPSVLASQVAVVAQRETWRLVTSEGTRLQHGRGFARLMIAAQAKAADGMDLAVTNSFEAEDPARLPKDPAIQAAIERLAADLAGLLRAPLVEPFVGPAMFSGRAAGVFFHEIFGHRIEGHRQKDETEGQTFAKSVNTPVLPDFLSVIFDPTRRSAGGMDLNGWYLYDDEGVKARPVTVVEKGILKTFLMSRAPVRGFDHSNGHGRRQPGAEVVSRQSNLLVESSRTVPAAQLRKMLIEEIRRQNKPYGYYFRDVTGGLTQTGRRGIQAFKVVPLVVYRVYPDGRPDELVRGADVVGTPLASFSKILATSDQVEVFNGYCGAESGNVPVAAVAPAILVSEIEIQKKEAAKDRPPLLPSPALDGGLR